MKVGELMDLLKNIDPNFELFVEPLSDEEGEDNSSTFEGCVKLVYDDDFDIVEVVS